MAWPTSSALSQSCLRRTVLKLIQHGRGLADLFALADQTDFVVPADDLHAERIADHPQISVGRAEQGQLFVRLFESDIQLHGN